MMADRYYPPSRELSQTYGATYTKVSDSVGFEAGVACIILVGRLFYRLSGSNLCEYVNLPNTACALSAASDHTKLSAKESRSQGF